MGRLTRDGTAELVSRDQILRRERGHRGHEHTILMDRADAFSIGAAVADAVARPLLSIYRSSLAKSASVKFAVLPSSSSNNYLLCSAIFNKVLQKTRASRSPSQRKF